MDILTKPEIEASLIPLTNLFLECIKGETSKKIEQLKANITPFNLINALHDSKSIEGEDYDRLLAKAYSLNISYNADIYAEPIKTNKQLEVGSIFVWCGEVLIVQESFHSSGKVSYIDGSLYGNNFYWDYQGNFMYVIGKIK